MCSNQHTVKDPTVGELLIKKKHTNQILLCDLKLIIIMIIIIEVIIIIIIIYKKNNNL